MLFCGGCQKKAWRSIAKKGKPLQRGCAFIQRRSSRVLFLGLVDNSRGERMTTGGGLGFSLCPAGFWRLKNLPGRTVTIGGGLFNNKTNYLAPRTVGKHCISEKSSFGGGADKSTFFGVATVQCLTVANNLFFVEIASLAA